MDPRDGFEGSFCLLGMHTLLRFMGHSMIQRPARCDTRAAHPISQACMRPVHTYLRCALIYIGSLSRHQSIPVY